MHSHGHREPPDTSKGYEQSDLAIGGIVKGVVLYFLFTIAVGLVVVVGLYMVGNLGPPKGEEMAKRTVPQEPNPLLQNNITMRTDIWNLRAREDTMLHSTTWVDQKQGIVRIPIDHAIDLMAAKGPAGLSLPAAPTVVKAPGGATTP